MTFLILEQPALRYIAVAVMVLESIGFWLYMRENKYLRTLLHRYLLSIHKNLDSIMTNEEQAQADITAILGAITGMATSQGAIAQELADLKNQIATADVPPALLTQLDDLAVRSAAVATSLQALLPVTAVVPAPAAPAPAEVPAPGAAPAP